jgi:hypothetical protein
MVIFTPRPLYPRERAPGSHWIGGWVGQRASLDDAEKGKFFTLAGLELRSLCLSARSQSLYYITLYYYIYKDLIVMTMMSEHNMTNIFKF